MQTKCQTLSRNIIEMADERTKLQATIETLKAQKGKLEQLCRTLQAERNAVKKADDGPFVASDATGNPEPLDESATTCPEESEPPTTH
jgi:cell division protein FtsB